MRHHFLTVALAIGVVAFGFAVFAEAGRPMGTDSPVLRAWANAYCARDYDALYALTYTPEHVERDEFALLASQYADQQRIQSGCYTEVVVHQARNTAVPAALRQTVMAARYYPEVDFYRSPTDRRTLGFTVMMTVSGQWLVYAPFITPTQEHRVPVGHTATIIDQDALPIGYAMVRGAAVVVQDSERVFVGVPLTLQTLGLPWITYRVQLLTDRAVAVPMPYRENLPAAHQSGFLAADGGSIGQNLTLDNVVWFRVDDINAVMTLAVTATTEPWDVSPNVYFEVMLEPAEPAPAGTVTQTFTPFADVRVVDQSGSEMIFEITFDTRDMPRDELVLACDSFILQIDDDWITPGFCDFKPDAWMLYLAPDERLTAAIWYDMGTTLDGEQGESRRLMYRMVENYALQVFDLWAAE